MTHALWPFWICHLPWCHYSWLTALPSNPIAPASPQPPVCARTRQVLLTTGGRVRIGSLGVPEVLASEGGGGVPPPGGPEAAALQRQDLSALGNLLLASAALQLALCSWLCWACACPPNFAPSCHRAAPLASGGVLCAMGCVPAGCTFPALQAANPDCLPHTACGRQVLACAGRGAAPSLDYVTAHFSREFCHVLAGLLAASEGQPLCLPTGRLACLRASEP